MIPTQLYSATNAYISSPRCAHSVVRAFLNAEALKQEWLSKHAQYNIDQEQPQRSAARAAIVDFLSREKAPRTQPQIKLGKVPFGVFSEKFPSYWSFIQSRFQSFLDAETKLQSLEFRKKGNKLVGPLAFEEASAFVTIYEDPALIEGFLKTANAAIQEPQNQHVLHGLAYNYGLSHAQRFLSTLLTVGLGVYGAFHLETAFTHPYLTTFGVSAAFMAGGFWGVSNHRVGYSMLMKGSTLSCFIDRVEESREGAGTRWVSLHVDIPISQNLLRAAFQDAEGHSEIQLDEEAQYTLWDSLRTMKHTQLGLNHMLHLDILYRNDLKAGTPEQLIVGLRIRRM